MCLVFGRLRIEKASEFIYFILYTVDLWWKHSENCLAYEGSFYDAEKPCQAMPDFILSLWPYFMIPSCLELPRPSNFPHSKWKSSWCWPWMKLHVLNEQQFDNDSSLKVFVFFVIKSIKIYWKKPTLIWQLIHLDFLRSYCTCQTICILRCWSW